MDVFSYWILTSTCKFKENISVSHPQRAKFLLSEIFWNLVITDRFHHGACQNLRREKQGFEAYIIGYLIWTTTICKLYIRKEAGYQSRSHMGHIANQIICKIPEITQSRLLDRNGIKVEVTSRRIIGKCLNSWKLNNILLSNSWVNKMSWGKWKNVFSYTKMKTQYNSSSFIHWENSWIPGDAWNRR